MAASPAPLASRIVSTRSSRKRCIASEHSSSWVTSRARRRKTGWPIWAILRSVTSARYHNSSTAAVASSKVQVLMMLAWSFAARTPDEIGRLVRALGRHRYLREADLRLHFLVDRALAGIPGAEFASVDFAPH